MEQEITVEYSAGTERDVTLHDGSVISLKKILPGFEPGSRRAALRALKDAAERGHVLTGLLYVDTDPSDLHDLLGTSSKPLASLPESVLCPGNSTLESINDSFR